MYFLSVLIGKGEIQGAFFIASIIHGPVPVRVKQDFKLNWGEGT